MKKIYLPVMTILAPIYFVSIGLKTDFVANFDLTIVLLVFSVACIGKILGAGLGAMIGGMTERKALAVGFGLNARGAMEIVLATAALDYGLIEGRIFVALVIMALATTMISGIGPAMADEDEAVSAQRPGSQCLCTSRRAVIIIWKVRSDSKLGFKGEESKCRILCQMLSLTAWACSARIPLARTKEEIENIGMGQILKVEADDPTAELDIPGWAKRAGHQVLKFERSGQIVTFWIKRMKQRRGK